MCIRDSIIGCGVAGEESLQKAVNNGVEVNLIDLSEQRLSQLKSKYGDEKINYIVSTPDSIADSIKDSDLILGSVYSLGKNAPKVVTDSMLDSVKPGAVMVWTSLLIKEDALKRLHQLLMMIQHSSIKA